MDIDGLVPWDGKEEHLPEHIRALGKGLIPPAWTDVRVSPDPASDLYVMGRDAKGRAQYRYSPDHVKRANERKFARIAAYLPHVARVHDFIRALDHDDVRDCLDLIFRTGLRPGSQRETAADKNARGATTLRGENVVLSGGHLQLEFVGKDGVFQSHRIGVHSLKDNLAERRGAAGEDGLLYPHASDWRLRIALEPLGLHPKDLRTLLACRIARKLLAGRAPAATESEYRRIRNQVGDAVAKRLGNTRSIALSSYIDPDIFAEWDPKGTLRFLQHKAGVKGAAKTAFDGSAHPAELAAGVNTRLRESSSGPELTEHDAAAHDARHGYFDDICEEAAPSSQT